VARGGVAARGVDLLQDHACRAEPETSTAVLLGDESSEPTVLGQRGDELVRVPVGLERAPVLAGEAIAQVAHSTTDLQQLVGGGRAHEASGHDIRAGMRAAARQWVRPLPVSGMVLRPLMAIIQPWSETLSAVFGAPSSWSCGR
jgi:hypothetical protein